jgi:hypothetical protein
MASLKSRLMFSKSDSMTVSESLMAKERLSEKFQRHADLFMEAAKMFHYQEEIKRMEDLLRKNG